MSERTLVLAASTTSAEGTTALLRCASNPFVPRRSDEAARPMNVASGASVFIGSHVTEMLCAGRIGKARPSTRDFAERARGENEPDSQLAESVMRGTSQL